jgi:mRNA interferase RelE/StbE
MKVEFRESFLKDLQAIRDATLRNRVRHLLEIIEQAQGVAEIPNFKRLRGDSRYARIRVGEYRIGLILDAERLVLVRLLHRKDIYRRFP